MIIDEFVGRARQIKVRREQDVGGIPPMVHLYAMDTGSGYQVLLIGSTRERWRGRERIFEDLDQQAFDRRWAAFSEDEIKRVVEKRRSSIARVTELVAQHSDKRNSLPSTPIKKADSLFVFQDD